MVRAKNSAFNKKKSSKKVVKKAVAKQPKKVIQKDNEENVSKAKPPRQSLARRFCELITSREYTDAEILEITSSEFPDSKGAKEQKIISHYRCKLNVGRMEGIGFPKPDEKYESIKRESEEEEESEEYEEE